MSENMNECEYEYHLSDINKMIQENQPINFEQCCV